MTTANVLLVDDDQDYLNTIRIQLEAAGYGVTAVESVGEAKERLDDNRPDVAIVDLMLEETDGGFALCHHIKRLDKALPVIMVSAVTSETGLEFDAQTRDERAWIKADAWLAKPIRFEQLLTELKRLLEA